MKVMKERKEERQDGKERQKRKQVMIESGKLKSKV